MGQYEQGGGQLVVTLLERFHVQPTIYWICGDELASGHAGSLWCVGLRYMQADVVAGQISLGGSVSELPAT